MGSVIGINSKEKEEISNGYGTVRKQNLPRKAQENSNEGKKSKLRTVEQGLVEDV